MKKIKPVLWHEQLDGKPRSWLKAIRAEIRYINTRGMRRYIARNSGQIIWVRYITKKTSKENGYNRKNRRR